MTSCSHRIRTAFIICALLATLPANSRSTLDRTIAKLNEDVITESDLARVLNEEAGSLAPAPSGALAAADSKSVGLLLDRTLLMQAAKKQKIAAPDGELQQHVETMIAEIRSKFGTEANFREALANDQMSLEELKAELLKRARIDYQVYQVVNSRSSISETDVKQYEAECVARGEAPLSLHLRRLAVPVKPGKGGAAAAAEEARTLTARIFTEGLAFEEGIRKYSKAPGAKEDGGDLGYLSTSKLSPKVVDATQNLQPGQASAPVVAGGFASIFYVESKRGARAALVQQRFEQNRKKLLAELQRKSDLKVFDENMRKLLPPEYQACLQSRTAVQSAATSVGSNQPGPTPLINR